MLVLLVYGCVTQIVFGTICPFVVFSGFPCPACGLTRGVCAILTGHWKMAAAYNITAFLWLPALIWFCFMRYIAGKNKICWEPVFIVIAIITVIYYIYRMKACFPGNPPMCYHAKNVQQTSAQFESFANSERYKTVDAKLVEFLGLRALLIQKDTKPDSIAEALFLCLRALLIQKDTKHSILLVLRNLRLRALLIKKDTKRVTSKLLNCKSLRALLI